MKIVLLIIDGLGDESIPALNNKTPLEAARTPNLDFLAEKGVCGLVETFLFPNEKFPTSEGTHVALFGYKNFFLGRGPYEVSGIGMEMKKRDIALRVNFATVNKNLKIIDRRAGRINDTKLLVKALSAIKIDGVKFLIKKSNGHRAGLILRGKGLSAKISDGDPHKVNSNVKKIVPLDKSKKAQFTADILNRFLEEAHQVLENHPLNKRRKSQGLLPANYLLVRGAGKFDETPSFKKRFGLKSCCIAGGGLYKGIAKILGMDLIEVKGATGFENTNLKGKFLAAKKALKKYDFVFCHVKAADTFAHDGNFQAKKKFIEKIDRNLKVLLGLKNTILVITADHSTCSLLREHCKDLCPILIFGDGKPSTTFRKKVVPGKDFVKEFSEKACRKGKLGKIKQINLMRKILNISKGL